MHEAAEGIQRRAQHAPGLLMIIRVDRPHHEARGGPIELAVEDQAVAVDHHVLEDGGVGVVEESQDGVAGDAAGHGDDDVG